MSPLSRHSRGLPLAAPLPILFVAACQVIGGIGDIEQTGPDASPPPAMTGHDGGFDATKPTHDSGNPRRHDAGGSSHEDTGPRSFDAPVTEGDSADAPDETTTQDTGTEADAPTAPPLDNPCVVGSLCISSGTTVDASLTCIDGSTSSCGAMNQPCCPGGSEGVAAFCQEANQGAVCSNGKCATCGGNNQPCCLESNGNGTTEVCNAGAQTEACVDGMCTNCGGSGQPCCPQGSDEDEGGCRSVGAELVVVCTSSGVCQQCSCQLEASCCDPMTGACVEPEDTCSNGQVCDQETLTCGNTGNDDGPPCGVAGAPCCGTSTCLDGSTCSAGECVACGGSAAPCCIDEAGNGACQAGFVCSARTCAACGAAGEPCCPGNQCVSGGCDQGTGRCVASMTCGG